MESEHTNQASQSDEETQTREDVNGPIISVSASSSSSENEDLEKGTFNDSEADAESPECSQTPQWSMLSASPDITTMRSPMVVPPGYDPNRIPSSVFSTKPGNPTEWSITSNESLFSIHMGKSGELMKLDEPSSSSTLPTVMEIPSHEENSSKSSNVSRHDKNNLFQDGKKIVIVELGNHRPSLSNARLSVESVNSATSFAFPVLTKDRSKTGSMRWSSEKQEKKEVQEQKETKESHKTSPLRRCFSWFSCWPRRCC